MFTIALHIRWKLLGAGLTAVLSVCAIGALLNRAATLDVYIAGAPFSRSELDELRTSLQDTVSEPIRLTWQGAAWQFTPKELGISVDYERALDQAVQISLLPAWTRVPLWIVGRLEDVHISLPVHSDTEALKNTLDEHVGVQDWAPLSARLHYGEPLGEVVPAVEGQRLDLIELQARLEQAVLAVGGERYVELPMVPVRPPVATEDVLAWEELHALGVATTTFDPTQIGRANNIRLAAGRMDGVILLPGDEFSLNAATGERTLETGYQEAPVIIDGQLVPGVGGGVSQLASTTFNAALLAGMRVTEYHNHSLPVPYLPLGRDATVWYDSLDLRFVNTLAYPVVVNATAGYDWVRVIIRSPEPIDQDVIVETHVVEEYPSPVEERLDPTLHAGERRLEQAGRAGQRIDIRQLIFTGGGLAEERRLEARYPPQPQVWAVGVAPGGPVPTS